MTKWDSDGPRDIPHDADFDKSPVHNHQRAKAEHGAKHTEFRVHREMQRPQFAECKHLNDRRDDSNRKTT